MFCSLFSLNHGVLRALSGRESGEPLAGSSGFNRSLWSGLVRYRTHSLTVAPRLLALTAPYGRSSFGANALPDGRASLAAPNLCSETKGLGACG